MAGARSRDENRNPYPRQWRRFPSPSAGRILGSPRYPTRSLSDSSPARCPLTSLRILYLTANPNRAAAMCRPRDGFACYALAGLCPYSRRIVWDRFRNGPAAKASRPTTCGFRSLIELDPGITWHRSLALIKIVRRHRIQLIHAIEHNIYPIAGDLGLAVPADRCGHSLPHRAGLRALGIRALASADLFAFSEPRQPTSLRGCG